MPERPLTTSAYIALGLLTTQDRSAYELAEQVGRGVDQLWPRADRQRYITPKRLLEAGLVTSRTEASGRRTRTVYSITPAGREALRQWFSSEAQPAALEFEGMIRLLLAEQATLDELRATLTGIRQQAVTARRMFASHARYIAETGGTFPERRHLFALANTFMIGHYDHIVGWVDWALEQTSSWPDTVTPAGDDEQVLRMLAPGIAAR